MHSFVLQAMSDELVKIAAGGRNIASLLARRMGTTQAPVLKQVTHNLDRSDVVKKLVGNVRSQFPAAGAPQTLRAAG